MMLKKLRRRIVLMLMAVFLVLIVGVIGCMSMINAQQTVERQKQNLLSAALKPMTHRYTEEQTESNAADTPFFAVRFDPDGQVTSVYRYAYEISEQKATRAAEIAVHSGHTSGLLREQQVRYLIRKDAEGYSRVTFISTAEDTAQQKQQLFYSLLLIPALLLLLFALVALPLSRQLTKPVQNAWDAQRNFIADASHELKTPLTVILANLSILQKNRQKTIEDCDGWLESTQEEAKQMRKLVEEMLLLARTEDEQPTTAFSEVNLSELLEKTIMTVEPMAFESGVTLSSDIEENITATYSETHIRQMMMILLDNAIKYAGDEKKVTVTLAKKQDRCELRVNNTGTPIPPDSLPHLFDRFYRGDATRATNGFGLGLSIAKRVVEMHKGTVRVFSNESDGTTFVVKIPVKSHG